MSSLCIKTNNEHIIDYLQNEFCNFNMLNVFFSCNEFKLYKNIIIHYKGIDTELFYSKIATILSYLVIDEFEDKIIKNILLSNYFYFDSSEFSEILKICDNNLSSPDFSFINRQMKIFDAFYDYISTHHSIVLSGFINFRLFNYKSLLENLVDLSVNEFIVEREYFEFISLVNLYVNSQSAKFGLIHIICYGNNILLLDENLDIIEINRSSLNAKYLSDITFSDNDYVLNTLLSLLPSKIYLHVASASNLDFIDTLKLIFENRITICTDCSICNLYKNLNIEKK